MSEFFREDDPEWTIFNLREQFVKGLLKAFETKKSGMWRQDRVT